MALPVPAKFVLRDGTLRVRTVEPPIERRCVNPKRTQPDHWLNLPRRKCDFCGKSYKPTQPFKKKQKYGFCSREHKEAFHAQGGAYSHAAEKLRREIGRQVRIFTRCPVCHARPRRKLCPDCEASGHVLTDYGVHLKEFIEYTVRETMLEFDHTRAIATGA